MKAWGPSTAAWTFFSTGNDAASVLFTSTPDILVCDATLPDMSGLDVVRMLKEENVYSQTPVILCFSEEEAREYTDWSNFIADDFLVFPMDTHLVSARLEFAHSKSTRTLDASPLTRLPGNTSIIKQTQALIDQGMDFALGYCDLDYFKPFNDKYGFSRGDEVLMMTARIILNAVHNLSLPISFVGHVGGDDYVFLVPVDSAETVCQNIIDAFDSIIPIFYDAADREKGGITSVDRKNVVCFFPLMTMSIAVVIKKGNNIKHYGEASSLAMSLKTFTKKSIGSSYTIERRGRAALPK